MTSGKSTQFAPAERVLQKTLLKQIGLFKCEITASMLLDGVPDAFVVLNQHRQIIYANDTFLQIVEIKEYDLLYGTRPGEAFRCIHACEQDGGCGTTLFCSQCGAVKAILNGLEGRLDAQDCSIQNEDGKSFDLRVWTKPLRLAGQNFVMFAIQDVHHEKRRQVMERLFFHDILNTASIITSIMDLATMDRGDNQAVDLNEYKHELNVASQRIIDEINAQRQIAAAEARMLEPHLLNLVVEGFVVDIVKTVQRLQFTRGVTIALVTGPDVSLYTDPALLGRVLINVIKNAVEASESGEVVTVSYKVVGDRIVFSVHNVMPMPQAVQLQVFNRSFSTKGDGRGLGTYSIKLLTEQYLNGQVWFESSEEGGTTFFAAYPQA